MWAISDWSSFSNIFFLLVNSSILIQCLCVWLLSSGNEDIIYKNKNFPRTPSYASKPVTLPILNVYLTRSPLSSIRPFYWLNPSVLRTLSYYLWKLLGLLTVKLKIVDQLILNPFYYVWIDRSYSFHVFSLIQIVIISR